MSAAAVAATRALLDGRPAGGLPFADRGLRYGDGLFETLRVVAGAPVWWDLHLARMARGCAALSLSLPPADLLEREALALCDGEDGVLRLLLTRGDGARGYAPASDTARRLWLFDPGAVPAPRPLRVGWGTLALASQPRLAGIKHLNRLEQVLAAAECAATGEDELLLADDQGHVTCGIAANLFVVQAGQLLTPLLDRCGVAGTCRSWLLAQHPETRVLRLDRALVEAADELFLCNSVRGILPVTRLAGRARPLGAVTRALAARLAREVPSLALEFDDSDG